MALLLLLDVYEADVREIDVRCRTSRADLGGENSIEDRVLLDIRVAEVDDLRQEVSYSLTYVPTSFRNTSSAAIRALF